MTFDVSVRSFDAEIVELILAESSASSVQLSELEFLIDNEDVGGVVAFITIFISPDVVGVVGDFDDNDIVFTIESFVVFVIFVVVGVVGDDKLVVTATGTVTAAAVVVTSSHFAGDFVSFKSSISILSSLVFEQLAVPLSLSEESFPLYLFLSICLQY